MRHALLVCCVGLALAGCGGLGGHPSTATTSQPVVNGDACALHNDSASCNADTQDGCHWLMMGLACPVSPDGGGCGSGGACVGPHPGCGGASDGGHVPNPGGGAPVPVTNACTGFTDAQSCDADTADHCYWFAALCPDYLLPDGGTGGCHGGSCVQEGSGGSCGGGQPDAGVLAGCGCASPAGTSGGGTDVCVEQVGGPAQSSPPAITCQPVAPGCVPVNGDVCGCVQGEGRCQASATVSGLCICDDGIR